MLLVIRAKPAASSLVFSRVFSFFFWGARFDPLVLLRRLLFFFFFFFLLVAHRIRRRRRRRKKDEEEEESNNNKKQQHSITPQRSCNNNCCICLPPLRISSQSQPETEFPTIINVNTASIFRFLNIKEIGCSSVGFLVVYIV